MPAYAIFIRDEPPHDAAEMATYSAKNQAAPRDPKLTMLSLYGATEALEGTAPDGVVLLQFPTMADARAWYESPSYQDAAQHRMRGSSYRVFLLEGV